VRSKDKLNAKLRRKALLLLIILLPQLLFLPLSGLDIISDLPDQDLSQSDLSRFEAAYDACFPVYTQPAGVFFPELPAKFVHAGEQKILEQHFLRSKMDYRKNNDITANHPISVYKFSLSVQTSDG
jgi:hypothetical protein